MSRKTKVKAALAILAFLCCLCILYVLLEKGEDALEGRAEETSEQTGELDRILWKEISLDGTTYRYSSDYETLLIIGTDGSGNQTEDRETYVGNMADFLLLLVVDPTEHTYASLQLNRDTMTEISLLGTDGTGRATATLQLCTAHWYGGTRKESCENTVKAVSHMLGDLTIDGYYELSMEDIGMLNHAAGGVTVTIEDDFSGIDDTLIQGEQVTLSDEQAVHFLRSRQGMADEENTSRMKRQRQYMEALLAKVSEKSREDSQFAIDIFDALTDVSLSDRSGGWFTDLLSDMEGAENLGIYTISGENTLGDHLGDGIEHAEYYLDQESLVQTMTDLYKLEEKK
jgi:LCP family protein required for cell wall assembly